MKKFNFLTEVPSRISRLILLFSFAFGLSLTADAQCSGQNLDLGTICSGMQFEDQTFTATQVNLGEVSFTLSQDLTQTSTVSFGIRGNSGQDEIASMGIRNETGINPGQEVTLCWDDIDLQIGNTYTLSIRFTYQ